MNNTIRVDTGFAYWIVDNDCPHNIPQIRSYIISHGFTPGDGTTFIVIHPSRMLENIPYILPAYGDPIEIAREHARLMDGDTFTTINYNINILDITKYTLSPDGEVMLDDERIDMSPIDAAYAKGIQYNRGDPILTFKALTSYILSRYDWQRVGMVMCDDTHKYAVRKVSGGPLHILPGIILYEWKC